VSIDDRELGQYLGDTPPLPEPLYAGVERGIRRDRRRRTLSWAAAAVLVLALGTGGWLGGIGGGPAPAAQAQSEELADELYDICGYLNGSSVDQELETFAVVSAGLF